MPFDAAGVFTPPDGSENAFPGQVIRSAVWNATFVDIADALTLLGKQLYGFTSVTTTPYVPLVTDALLLVNLGSPVSINLPVASTRSGYPLIVKDVSGVAHTNNITIVPNGAELIDGLGFVAITVDYGGYRLFPRGAGWVLLP